VRGTAVEIEGVTKKTAWVSGTVAKSELGEGTGDDKEEEDEEGESAGEDIVHWAESWTVVEDEAFILDAETEEDVAPTILASDSEVTEDDTVAVAVGVIVGTESEALGVGGESGMKRSTSVPATSEAEAPDPGLRSFRRGEGESGRVKWSLSLSLSLSLSNSFFLLRPRRLHLPSWHISPILRLRQRLHGRPTPDEKKHFQKLKKRIATYIKNLNRILNKMK
jgi:hypothetical protein